MAATPVLVVNGDLVEANIYCVQTNQVSINRVHYKVTALTAPGVSLADCVAAVDSAAVGNYKLLLSSAAGYSGVSGRIVFPVARKSLYSYTKISSGAGTAGFNLMPRQTCGMFTKVSGIPGPGGRGRMYVAFPSTADQDATGDRPTAGYMLNLGAFAAGMFAQLPVGVGASTATLVPVIYKKINPAASPAWTTASARRKWATHRSRGDYGRPNVLPDELL